MNTEEFEEWQKKMFQALLCFYTEEEAKIIINFTWKASNEGDLIGEKALSSLSDIHDVLWGKSEDKDVPKYEFGMPKTLEVSMTHRLFLYAPMILQEYEEEGLT